MNYVDTESRDAVGGGCEFLKSIIIINVTSDSTSQWVKGSVERYAKGNQSRL